MNIARVLLLACLIAALPAQAKTVYRWVDSGGTVHYGEQPSPVYPSTAVEISSSEAREVLGEDDAPPAAADSERQQYCQRATRNLELLNSPGQITYKDEYGVEKVLSEQERAEQRTRAEEAIARYCD